jgi:sulfofructose kinase
MTPFPPPQDFPRWDVLGVGSCAVDDRLFVDHFPNPDEKMPIRAARRQAGGQTSTALVAAARMGSRAAFAARLGDDELSRYMIAELEHSR